MPPRRIVDQLNDEPELDDDRGPDDQDPDEGVDASADDDDDSQVGDGDDNQNDDQGDDGDDGQEPEPQPRRRAPGGRRDETVRQLRARAQAAERELELARAQGGNRQSYEPESEAVRRARLEAMEPAERMEYLLNEERAERRRERQMDNFRHADETDRTNFNALVRSEPTLKKYADEVEHRLRLLRAAGQNAPRESVLKFVLGERVIAGRSSPKGKAQRQAADERVSRQQVTLPKGKGERGSRGGSKSADLEKRLTGVPI